jgi:hypothetical protein
MRGPAAALAFGLGIGLPCLLAVGAAAFGWEVPGTVYGALAGVGFSVGLIVAAVVDGLLQRAERLASTRKSNALTAEIELKNAGRVVPVASVARPPTESVVVRYATGTVNGREREPFEIATEPRPAKWTAWQEAALTWLDWHALRRSLTRDALTGPGLAFGKPADWVEFTDELARVGLANKENGKPTVLALPLPMVRKQIMSGLVEWRTDTAPPTIASPYPADSAVVEMQKA